MNRAGITPRPQYARSYRTPPGEAGPGYGFGSVSAIAYGLLGLVPAPATPGPNGPGYVTGLTYALIGLTPWTGPQAGRT